MYDTQLGSTAFVICLSNDATLTWYKTNIIGTPNEFTLDNSDPTSMAKYSIVMPFVREDTTTSEYQTELIIFNLNVNDIATYSCRNSYNQSSSVNLTSRKALFYKL